MSEGSEQTARDALLAVGDAAAGLVIGTDPLAGLRAARSIELAARSAVLGYVRACRERGVSWHEIGAAAGLSSADDSGLTVAGRAFTLATDPLRHAWSRDFAWTCRTCGGPVTDHGPGRSPGEQEDGHAPGCQQLAAAVRAWLAESASGV
jgi:hypothetical protein